jgi:hypothetical protein
LKISINDILVQKSNGTIYIRRQRIDNIDRSLASPARKLAWIQFGRAAKRETGKTGLMTYNEIPMPRGAYAVGISLKGKRMLHGQLDRQEKKLEYQLKKLAEKPVRPNNSTGALVSDRRMNSISYNSEVTNVNETELTQSVERIEQKVDNDKPDLEGKENFTTLHTRMPSRIEEFAMLFSA